MKILIIVVISYLIGSIPVGYIVARYLKGVDIRDYGSGNIGATNVFRIMGAKAGLIVLIGDVLKGVLAVLIAKNFGPVPVVTLLASLAVLSGHSWSIFLSFRGGKAIATGYGVLLTIAPLPGFLAVIVWAITVFATGYVSLGSLLGTTSAFLFMLAFRLRWEYVLTAFLLVLLAVYRHKDNIKRLLNGTENRFKIRSRRNLR